MSGTDVVTRAPNPTLTHLNARQYDPQVVELIKKTVAKGTTNAELYMFLELASRYELDPFAREIWCVKQKGRDGDESGGVLIMVGRDGMLKTARNQGLEEFDSDVHRAKDRFLVNRRADGTRDVDHSYAGSDEQRGPIVGAWCIAKKEGEKAVYFYAPLKEYLPKNERKLRYSPWGSQQSVMILKCAQTTALRIAFSLTGIIGAEEISGQIIDGAASEESAWDDVPWGFDDEVAARLRAAVARANDLYPNTYTIAQLQMMLGGREPAELEQIAQQMEQENVARAEKKAAEPVDAHVVVDHASAEGVEGEPEEMVEGEAVGDVDDPSGDNPEDDGRIEMPPEVAEELRGRFSSKLDELADAQERDDVSPDEIAELEAEVESIEGDLRAAGELPDQVNPDQSALDL